MRRRLRFAANAGLLAAAAAALFWGIWFLATGEVPATTALPWTGYTSFALPFAVSRLWDVPAAFLWATGLALVWTDVVPASDSRVDDPYTRLYAGLSYGLVFTLTAGLYAGLYAGLAAGLLYGLYAGLAAGLLYGLCVGLGGGLAAGMGVGLAAGLLYGLATGLSYGLALTVPMVLVTAPIIVAIGEHARRRRAKSAG
jgi:hypothetical protein